MSLVLPGRHFVPTFVTRPARLTANTSVKPFVSFLVRFEASDWKAIRRAQRRSLEITAFVEGPFGRPPSRARETRRVVCWLARVLAAPAGAVRRSAAATATGAVSLIPM
jgi:hypothetical protein